MPVFKNRATLEVAKKIRAFLNQSMGGVPRMTPGKRARQRVVSKNGGTVALSRELVRARGAMRSPIFFVVGHQKSGTTWLMTTLDSHPEILCQGEGRPFGRNWRQEHLKQRRVSYPPTSLYNAIASSEDLRYWIERSVWSRGDDSDEHLANLTGLAVEYFLTQQLLGTGKRLVGDKTVLSDPGIVEEIGKICPDAKVIHIIRDGRDVLVSQMHHRWNQAEDQGGTSKITSSQLAKRERYREDPQRLLNTKKGIFPRKWVGNNAAKWGDVISKTREDGRALLGANYEEVRYEDLLERPEEEVGRLLEFLGADASEQAVRRCVSAASFEKLTGGRERGQEAASFFRKGIAGDWKNVFTEKNKQEFKAAAGNLLVKLGYEEDDDW
ncbi:MAG: sulfotransferase domain-containing protein [Rubrobacter sp.]|nr:sulfotransferase domain-containing protein [Rubrobacter sp.]